VKFSVGNIFTSVGGIVAIFGVVAMAIGLKFVVPPEVLTVVVYKGIFAAAGGLMIVGAILGRHANRKRHAAELERKNAALVNPALPGDTVDTGDAEGGQTAERIYRDGR
jgi:membrane-bound ClpP family serine protease